MRLASEILFMAAGRVLSNCRMSRRRYCAETKECLRFSIARSHCYRLTVNGIPNRDSLPKVSSGKDTPISDIDISCEDTPIDSTRYHHHRALRMQSFTSYGSNPSSPANISKAISTTSIWMVYCDLRIVLERPCIGV